MSLFDNLNIQIAGGLDIQLPKMVDIEQKFVNQPIVDIETAVTHLAQHHARWWQDLQLKTIDYLDPINSTTTEGHEWFKSCWEQYEDKLTDAFPDCYIPANYLHLGYHAIEQMLTINDGFTS